MISTKEHVKRKTDRHFSTTASRSAVELVLDDVIHGGPVNLPGQQTA